LQADVTENSQDDQALLKRYDLIGPPGIIFFDAGGDERAVSRVIGYKKSEDFVQILQKL
jgi:thiol:disulfide interchange protein DsbD